LFVQSVLFHHFHLQELFHARALFVLLAVAGCSSSALVVD
jgi:hypothetical protein